jgi:hypothetical protein
MQVNIWHMFHKRIDTIKNIHSYKRAHSFALNIFEWKLMLQTNVSVIKSLKQNTTYIRSNMLSEN